MVPLRPDGGACQASTIVAFLYPYVLTDPLSASGPLARMIAAVDAALASEQTSVCDIPGYSQLYPYTLAEARAWLAQYNESRTDSYLQAVIADIAGFHADPQEAWRWVYR